MARIENHQLPNFSFLRKLLASLALVFGLFLFVSAWIIGVIFSSWDFSAASLRVLGDSLMVLREQSSRTFYLALVLHAVSVPMILAITRRLVDKTAISRGVRTLIMGVPIVLILLDLACWALIPISQAARTFLGLLLVLETLCLLTLVVIPIREMWFYTRWKNPDGKKRRVVIVGGGFGGLYTAMGLDKALGYHKDLEIILIDKKNYFLFPPLLPSVAVGSIESRQVTYPFRRIFEATNITFRKELVEKIDVENKSLVTRVAVDQDPDSQAMVQAVSRLEYDYLVLAPGSETNTFNTEGVEEYAFFMREIGDAIAVRNHIIDCFELAARESNVSAQREMLRFVIVGGGPTGVELASEVNDLIYHVLLRRYPEVNRNFIEIYLIQSGPALLPGWHETLVGRTTEQLSRLSIKLLMGMRVVKVGSRTVTLNTGETLATRTCLWCTGVKPASILASCNLPRHKTGRIEVAPDLRAKGLDAVFVLGDATYLEDADGRPYPALAQVALQQGTQTAGNLVQLIKGKSTRPFKYFNYGSLVSVGEHYAVIELMGVRLSGFLAWLIWRSLYLAKLVGFGNRIRVVLDWTMDLLVERSISQIWTSRQEVQTRAANEPSKTPAPAAERAL